MDAAAWRPGRTLFVGGMKIQMRHFPDAVPGPVRKAFYFHVSVTARGRGQTSPACKVFTRHQARTARPDPALHVIFHGKFHGWVSRSDPRPRVGESARRWPSGACSCWGLGTSAGNQAALWAGMVFYYGIRSVILDK